MTWKAYAAVSGAGLLATYLGVAQPAVAPAGRMARPAAAAVPAAPSPELEAEALKLQKRVAHGEYHAPSRDPFHFVARDARGRNVPASVPPAVVVLPQAAPEPLIRLSGISARLVDGANQRVAFLVTGQGLADVREGDVVAGNYRVTRIQDDAVELTGPDGAIRRLPLRP